MPYTNRIQKLKRALSRRKLDGILVSQPHNRRYLCGYSADDHGIQESSGVLLVLRRGKPLLLTDFRFHQQAVTEVQNCKVMLYPRGLINLLKTLLPDLSIAKLGFESNYTLYSTAATLKQLCKDQRISLTPISDLIEKMRLVKTEQEIDIIRRSVQLNEKVFQEVYARLTPDQTEVDVALDIAATMRRAGAEGESFDSIVATDAASALPHAIPRQQKLKKDHPLLIDMGLVLDGYCSDMTRTICLGNPDPKFKKIHRIVRKAQLAAIRAVRQGVTCQEVDRIARTVIAEAGYGKYFGHALGHGVGMAVHEAPRVSAKSSKILRAGMVITIEPGIYLPGWGGIRLENMVVVREHNCEELNTDTTWLDI